MISDELKAHIGRLITDAAERENAGNRSDLLDRYLGEPYGDEVDGRSKFIDTSSADAVEALLPEIMEVFTSAEHILEFRPVGPEDELAAKQETAAVRHIFWQENNGFENLYTWFKEAMIQQNAYVWRGWVEKEETEIEEYEGLDLEEYMTVLSQLDGEYEVLELTGLSFDEAGNPIPEIGEDGQIMGIDTRIRCVKETKEYLIEPFPQEDFFGTPRWGKVCLDGIPCCGRIHRNKTREDWIAFGFSEKSLEAVSEPGSDEEETAARHHTNDLDESEETVEYLELYETYIRVDLDGDGIPELVQVWCDEDASQIMEWKDGGQAVTEVSSVPISAVTPYIMPHRHIGRSVVESVDDLQRVKTVLMRQALDNVYITNYARPMFDESQAGENLLQDLSSPNPGAPIRTGGALVEWTKPPQLLGDILPMIEKFDNMQEMRVGATRYNQGLDADSLNKTARGIGMIMNASQKKAKLIARTFAETGLRDLFLGVHRDLRKGPVKELMVQMRGQWVKVNPRLWKTRTDMTVNVGMGRGDRDERRQALMLVAATQEKLIAAGSRMVDESKLFASITDTLDTYGVMGAEKYFHDPQRLPPPPPPPPPPPDPIMVSAQAQAQKVMADAQIGAAKLQADEREKDRQFQLKMAQLKLEELRLMNAMQNETDTLDLKRKEVVMNDDLERDKLSVQGASAVPYGQVTGDRE